MFKDHYKVEELHHLPEPPNEEDLEKHTFILIRHALTEFNTAFAEMYTKYGDNSEEYRKMKIDKAYIDLPIKQEGITQCEES
jgi:hypothetical protein